MFDFGFEYIWWTGSLILLGALLSIIVTFVVSYLALLLADLVYSFIEHYKHYKERLIRDGEVPFEILGLRWFDKQQSVWDWLEYTYFDNPGPFFLTIFSIVAWPIMSVVGLIYIIHRLCQLWLRRSVKAALLLHPDKKVREKYQ